MSGRKCPNSCSGGVSLAEQEGGLGCLPLMNQAAFLARCFWLLCWLQFPGNKRPRKLLPSVCAEKAGHGGGEGVGEGSRCPGSLGLSDAWLGGIADGSDVPYTERLQVRSPVRVCTGGNPSMFPSLSLSPCLCLPPFLSL